MAAYRHPRPALEPHPAPDRGVNGADLKTLLRRLNQDVTQLAHDELELAKLEIREVAEAFSHDLREASATLVKNMAKVGVALTLAMLAGLALTAGAILGVGRLLGGAFWAGGLIVGLLLLAGAAAAGMSAARSLQESDALRMERGRRTLERNRAVLEDEARETKDFVQDEAEAFKRHATPPEEPPPSRHRA
jgi:hypothetical protein